MIFRYSSYILCAFFISILILIQFGISQTVNLNELRGATLCVEHRSVQVSITEGNSVENTAMMEVIQERLELSLISTLERFDIPFHTKTNCDGEEGFVYILYITSLGQDNSANPFLFYAALLQVGETTTSLKTDLSNKLPNPTFNQFFNTVVFEKELTLGIYEGIAETNEKMIENLALAWWDSFTLVEKERLQKQAMWVKIGTGVSISLFVVILIIGIFYIMKKRKKQISDTNPA